GRLRAPLRHALVRGDRGDHARPLRAGPDTRDARLDRAAARAVRDSAGEGAGDARARRRLPRPVLPDGPRAARPLDRVPLRGLAPGLARDVADLEISRERGL